MGIAALLALTGSVTAQDTPAEFKSEAGKFSILFPEKPAEQKRTADTPGGLIETHRYVAAKDGVQYLVSHVDYPAATVKEAGADAILEATRDSLTETVKGKLLSDKKATLDGNPGREFVIDNEKQHYRVRQFLVTNRLYQVVNAGPKEKIATEPVEKFQASFKLLK